MAYTFQSRATADLIMLRTSAEQILKLLDRPLGQPGIITVAQVPAVLRVLEQAAAEDDARRKALQEQQSQEDVEGQSKVAQLNAVSLRQRIVPFAEMLRRSQASEQAVTWVVA